MRILITGSRDWGRAAPISDAIITYVRDHSEDRWHPDRANITVVTGGAKGADRIAALAARSLGLNVEVHEAQWSSAGSAAGPIRNQEMVDAGADVCLAFPLGESRGTRDCMRRAAKAGIPVIEYGAGALPDNQLRE